MKTWPDIVAGLSLSTLAQGHTAAMVCTYFNTIACITSQTGAIVRTPHWSDIHLRQNALCSVCNGRENHVFIQGRNHLTITMSSTVPVMKFPTPNSVPIVSHQDAPHLLVLIYEELFLNSFRNRLEDLPATPCKLDLANIFDRRIHGITHSLRSGIRHPSVNDWSRPLRRASSETPWPHCCAMASWAARGS